MLDKVTYEGGDYPKLILKDSSAAPLGTAWHEIPIQAIADRVELLGLESIEQALEYIGLEFHRGDISDTLHAPMQDAYREVVQSEYAQSLMPSPKMDESRRQTLFQPMSIGRTKRDNLAGVRDDVLNTLGMSSRIHSIPMARVVDASRPVERTRPAAAEALNATPGAIEAAVQLVQEHLDEVEAWRGHTVLSFTPQLLGQLQREEEA